MGQTVAPLLQMVELSFSNKLTYRLSSYVAGINPFRFHALQTFFQILDFVIFSFLKKKKGFLRSQINPNFLDFFTFLMLIRSF